MKAAPKLTAPLLVLLARHDRYTSVADNRRLLRATASRDKSLAVYPGSYHGWDLLYYAPYKTRVSDRVFTFLLRHSASGAAQ